MIRRSLPSALAVLVALAPTFAGCDDGATPTPAPTVSFVTVSPGDTLLLPGDTLRLEARAFGPDDAQIEGLELAWRSTSQEVADVDDAGLLTARGTGETRIEASAPRGQRGFAEVRVRTLAGFQPNHGAFGETVTIVGTELDRATAVRFGGFDAFISSVSEDGRTIDAWVPVFALTGPVSVMVDGEERVSESPFYVTGLGDDALEPSGYDRPMPIAFPFENPSLVTRPPFEDVDVDLFRFTVSRSGPFRATVIDRSPLRDRFRAVRMELLDVAVADMIGIVATWSSLADNELRPASIDVAQLPAGTYDLLITPFGFSANATLLPGDRSYGLALDTLPSFVLEPDSLEPDDYPPMATVVPFPFTGGFRIENPYGADYFRFSLSDSTDLWLVTAPAVKDRQVEEDVDLFLMSAPAKAVQYVVATGQFPEVYHASITDWSSWEEIYVRVPPGDYLVGVLDLVGSPASYDLWIGTDAPDAGAAGVAAPLLSEPSRPATSGGSPSHSLEELRAKVKAWASPRPRDRRP